MKETLSEKEKLLVMKFESLMYMKNVQIEGEIACSEIRTIKNYEKTLREAEKLLVTKSEL